MFWDWRGASRVDDSASQGIPLLVLEVCLVGS